MSWRNNLAALLLPWLLSACGFTPLYSQTDAKSAASGHSALRELAGIEIQVQQTNGRIGQQLRSDLEDRLNPGKIVVSDPKYRLVTYVNLGEAPIAVSRDGTISRFNLFLNSPFSLYNRKTGRVVYQSTVTRASSYNVQTNAYFSTYVARDDAIRRGITELAEQYRQRLAAYLVQQEGKNPDTVIVKERPSMEQNVPMDVILPTQTGSPFNPSPFR